MQVLIVTHSEDDYCAPRVAQALQARGARPFVLETDRFPTEVSLVWTRHGGVLRDPRQGALRLRDASAIWFRRDSTAQRLPPGMDPELRRAAALESRSVLQGALTDTDALLVDAPWVYERARQKPLQLALARQVGLAVPRTVETNDPDAVRALAATCPGGVVAKMYNDVRVGDATVYTNVLGPDDLAALDDLVTCPMIFQEAVPKARELRVFCVGRRVAAAAIDSQRHEGTRVDWRRQGALRLHEWEPYELPEDFVRRFTGLADLLGCNYCAADVILRPDGELVLLETNIVGEFFWMDEALGLSDSLAELLVGRAEARRPVGADAA